MCYAHDELKDNHSPIEDVVAAAFLDGIDYAEHHPHWISVGDELPKEKDWVLAIEDDKVAEWYYEGENLREIKDVYNITHWMPLPQAPKKGGEE